MHPRGGKDMNKARNIKKLANGIAWRLAQVFPLIEELMGQGWETQNVMQLRDAVHAAHDPAKSLADAARKLSR